MELTNPPQAQTQAEAEQDESLNVTNSDKFSFDEFFDFSNEEENDDVQLNINADVFRTVKADSESLFGDSSSNSSLADFGSSILTSDLCFPYDDLAELEWVSTFAEESFSGEDMEKLQFISGQSSARSEQTRPDPYINGYNILVPGKARSKRARTAPKNWSTRLLIVSGLKPDTDPKQMKKHRIVRKCGAENVPAEGRRCVHCETDKTPQWRTGPLGAKTLCNACGVRYKSGRLVPEYRPASSPTFVKTEHSNSHRKVLELRKRKQYCDVGYDGSDCEDYLIHRPDFGEQI